LHLVCMQSTAPTKNYTLSLHDALPISEIGELKASKEIIERLFRNADKNKEINLVQLAELAFMSDYRLSRRIMTEAIKRLENDARSEEHTSELQSRFDLVCRLLLEKKKK